MRILLFAVALMLSAVCMYAQGVPIDDVGTISGSLQSDIQTYTEDTVIQAPDVPEQMLSNQFMNVLFTRGKFSAGLRFEAYLNPLLGIDQRYGTTGNGTGMGIPYRFVRYSDTYFDVTAGNFYEQFGSGMVLRLYEERNLGFDNSIDGIRMKFMPTAGLTVTGFLGRQRAFWELSEGIMRGGDVNLDLNEVADFLPDGMHAILGASVVSRYQTDNNPFLNLPENVLAWALRGTFGLGDVTVDAEYAYKINDPGATNGGSYNPGNALYVNAAWASKGVGINLASKRIDNFDFRSDRTAAGLYQQVNYLPAISKQHTWRLITLYPYATQPTGEFGVAGDATFTIPKGSFLGDDETTISLNGSVIHALDTTRTDAFHYTANFGWSDRVFFRDLNVDISRKFGTDFKITLAYINLAYDQDVIEGKASINDTIYGVIDVNFACVELWFKTGKGQSLRTEFQWMGTGYMPEVHDRTLLNGNWVLALAEYSVSPHWFFSVYDEWNYGNRDEALQVHYPSVSTAYVIDALRVQAGYGRVRGGLLCVGGICRPVFPSNGFTLNTTYSF